MKILFRFAAFIVFAAATPFFLVSCGNRAKITEYDITAELDGNTLTGRETVTFYNSYDTSFKELKFNLFPNAFRSGAKVKPIAEQYKGIAYYNGENYGDMEILSVAENGVPVDFTVGGEDRNVLTVPLQTEVFPEEKATLTVEFKVELAEVIARTGITKKTVNLANFYPILCAVDKDGFYECLYYPVGDPYFSECANYTVTLTFDDNLAMATSGYPVKSETAGDKKKETYKIENARSFSAVASENFLVVSAKYRDTQVNYYYYDDDNPEEFLDYAVRSLDLFGRLFGEYPYKTYSVAKTGFIQGGMEFPALVYISDDLERKAFGEVIAHETAHQWWQTVVGNNETEYGFLDEGLAEYSVVLFYENYSDYGYTRKNLLAASEKTYKTFCSVSDKLFGKVNTVMTRSLKDFNSEYEYVNIAYVKPCIMYDTLRETIGDKKFFAGLKKYYSDYAFKIAAPDDLVGAFEKTGTDVNGFFDGFFYGKVIL